MYSELYEMKILWLHEKNLSQKMRHTFQKLFMKVGIEPTNVFWVCPQFKITDLWIKRGKQTWKVNEEKRKEVLEFLTGYIKRFNIDLVVVNDPTILYFIAGTESLDLCRGSVYMYDHIPLIVIDRHEKIFSLRYGSWLAVQDFKKIKRWADETQRQEPKFDYKICRSRSNLVEAKEFLAECFLIAIDIETSHDFITCIGYTGLKQTGEMFSYVIPFFSTQTETGAFWAELNDEIFAWQIVEEVNKNDAFKCFQNGQYDGAYLIKYRCPVTNYLFDTLHLMHSIWTEAPKKLNFIASIFVDHYRFWKDEAKGESEDKDKSLRVPITEKGLEQYWRYNALDTYYTLLNCLYLSKLITNPNMEWARTNYRIEFMNQFGPAMIMSMNGMRIDKTRQNMKFDENIAAYKKNLKELQIMCDDGEFNPNSPDQVASLLYDVLGAPVIEKKNKQQKISKRPTDEKTLNIIRTYHPLFQMFIDKIWATKKPRNNASKYGLMYCPNDRFLYQVSAAGTVTGRYSGKQHMWWVGQQPQNIPADMRDMMVADENYFFLEVDYEKSDMWFVAHESLEEKMIETLQSGVDIHSIHAADFFSVDFDKVIEGKKNDEEWVVHSTRGVRQNSKRIGHGANYMMQGNTLLFEIMGREAAVETARFLGHKDANDWSMKKLAQFCDFLLQKYYKRYKRLPDWFSEAITEAVKNGNRAVSYGGRTRLFFGDLYNNSKIQRDLISNFGQGGTAGNINNALLDIFWRSGLREQGVMILLQVHDSALFQIPISKWWLGQEVINWMEQECEVKGRKFTVPVEAKCGFSWKGGMIPWENKEEILSKMKESELNFRQKKKYPIDNWLIDGYNLDAVLKESLDQLSTETQEMENG